MKAAFLREVQLVALEEVAFKLIPEGRSSQPEKSEEEENSKQGSTGVKVRVRKIFRSKTRKRPVSLEQAAKGRSVPCVTRDWAGSVMKCLQGQQIRLDFILKVRDSLLWII